ncbi:MAG: hypothetical protein JSW33_02995 [bacterium]|nr:MAG: hypothetical protein JSW33_02995 [bacterium]
MGLTGMGNRSLQHQGQVLLLRFILKHESEEEIGLKNLDWKLHSSKSSSWRRVSLNEKEA